MRHALDEVGPPRSAVVRIGWRGEPLSPPPWDKALADGTFGNRFDDPGPTRENVAGERFRCLYFGGSEEAAFGETLAHRRVPVSVLAKLAVVEDSESVLAAVSGATIDLAERGRPRGVVTADWQARRQIGRTLLHPSLRFADISTRASLQYLRSALAPIADRLDIAEVDASTMLNPALRAFTQACARHIYELHDEETPRFAGIRYRSRLDPNTWECWAVFFDRIRHTPEAPQEITPENAALRRVARAFDLAIEAKDGVLLRP